MATKGEAADRLANNPDEPCEQKVTFLTAEELTSLTEKFSAIDLDKDGKLTRSELKTLANSMGLTPSNKEINLWSTKHKLVGKGKLLIDLPKSIEFISAKKKELTQEDFLKETFRIFDRDGNGRISGDEIKLVLGQIIDDISDEEIEKMISEADLDGDGQINYKEYVLMLTGDD